MSAYWQVLREGSNIEVPNFRRYTGPPRFPLATGKSKKLYDRAVARALYNECDKPFGLHHSGVAYDADAAVAADERLFDRCYR